jgi:hypothetical protein
MRRNRKSLAILDDETSSAGTDRVMRAYWLAPRVARAATILALQGAPTSRRDDEDFRLPTLL